MQKCEKKMKCQKSKNPKNFTAGMIKARSTRELKIELIYLGELIYVPWRLNHGAKHV